MNMSITEVRIRLSDADPSRTKFRAYCSIVIDGCFTIHSIRILEGYNGPFVCMPSKKRTENCPHCRAKNHMSARYCNNCGKMLRSPEQDHVSYDVNDLYTEVAHPITQECRTVVDRAVLDAYKRALEEANQPEPEAADIPPTTNYS